MARRTISSENRVPPAPRVFRRHRDWPQAFLVESCVMTPASQVSIARL
jgi:hypothetical protein